MHGHIVCEEREEFKEFRSSGWTDHKIARLKGHFCVVGYRNNPALCSMLLNF